MTEPKTSEAILPHKTDLEILRASEEKYRNLLENVRDIIFEIDATGMLTYINPAVRNVFEVEPQDLTGKNFLEFVHPDDADLLIKRFSELSQGIERPLEYRIGIKPGEFRYVRTYTKPIFKENIFKGACGTLIDITERKLADEALRTSEDNLRSFFQTISERVFLMKPDGEILAANEPFAKALGRPVEDLIGHCAFDYLDPMVAARRRAWVNEVARSGKPMRVEDERQNCIVVHNIYPILNSQGFVDRLAVYATDVTEARRSESALKESEERYRTLFENMIEGFAYCKMLYDQDGRPDDWIYLNVNNAFGKLTGLGDVVGRRVTEVIPGIKEAHADLFEIYGTVATTGQARRFEFYVEPLGIWFNVSAHSPEKDYFVAVFENITGRKLAQEALTKRENYLKLLLKSMINAFVLFESVFDDRGNFVSYRFGFINEAFEKITGVKNRDVRGKTVHQVWPEIEPQWIEAYGKVALTGKPSSFEMFHKPTGKFYRCNVYRPGLSPNRFCVIFEDVTERLLAEEEKEALRSQLLHAQKMEAIGKLADGIAHDFNNLLQIILGYAQTMLVSKNEGDVDYSEIEQIYQAGLRGADLVKSLMTFSRKAEIKTKPINLNNQLEKLTKMLSTAMPKMIEIQKILDPELALIDADPTQIDQVIVNLAVNAKDAMGDQGALTIKTGNVVLDEDYCKTHMGVKPAGYVLLSVSDSGHGMDRETIEHIFEPFFTTKGEGKGTGLGLSTVYGIVKRHNGSIECESELGRGTTFKIYFPAITTLEKANEGKIPETTTRGGTESVLLVDDEDSVLLVVARILRKAGYTVFTASGGEDALALFKRELGRISLVILDILMPGMGGHECLDALQKIDPKVKVILATGAPVISQLPGLAPKNGSSTLINKPYDMTTLLSVVRDTLDRE